MTTKQIGYSSEKDFHLIKILLTVFLFVFMPRVSLYAQSEDKVSEKPNILVILVDDMGFSDLGSYGGEISTPNVDRLAARGLRYTQFYNTAKCHSSRISLLTGRYPFQAGNNSLRHSVTIPEMLKQNGYFTAMTGKWHLDNEPTDYGFDRYLGHLSGFTNYFTGDETFRLNGNKWEVPDNDFYTTIANTDYTIKFLNEAREAEKPWFMYIAHNAPHGPLQSLKKDFEKYKETYKVGWDSIRQERLRKQQQIGLFDEDLQVPSRPEYLPPWDDLSDKRKKIESDRMAAYAALIDRVDQELGRLLADIKDHGELENTFILFLSDNGASPYERHKRGDVRPWNPKSKWNTGTAWAWLSNTPFRNYKQNQFEGGIATPAVVHWPEGIKGTPGSIVRDPAHIIDILPTLADISNTSIPGHWPGRELNPVAGISFAPTFKNQPLEERDLYLQFNKDRALRRGDWKLVSFREQPWELYHISQDRTEIYDVVDEYPEIALELAERWYKMATYIDKSPIQHRSVLSPTEVRKLHPEWTDYNKEEVGQLRESGRIQKIKRVYK